MEDIEHRFDIICLGQYRAAFAVNAIDSEILTNLTEQDLERLGLLI